MTTPPAAPAARVIDDGLRHDAAILLQDRRCMEWIEEHAKFLRQDLGSRHISEVRRDVAGLWFIDECLSILNRVAGTED